MTYPWEKLPAPTEPPAATADVIALLQADLRYIVTHTAVVVRSNRPELVMLVNTQRGQIIPQGVCRFTDGTTAEFQDIGMPQVGAPLMTVKELAASVWNVAKDLGLELEQ